MKKRRTLIISLLLVAALALGIGYAEFTSTMNVNGEIQMGGIASQVYFSNAEVNAAQSTADVVTTTILGVGEGSTAITLKMAGFIHAEHYVVVDVEVKNPHDFDAVLQDLTVTQDGNKNPAGDDLFKVEVLGLDFDSKPTLTKDGGTLTFQVKVTCLATTPNNTTENFTITFNAHAQ